MSKFIIALIVSIIDEIINNNFNFKTKAISAKLKINYCFIHCYNRVFKQNSNLNNRRNLLKLIFR